MQLVDEISAKKTCLLDFYTRGNLQTRITNNGFCEQLNSYNDDKDFNNPLGV